MPVAGGATGKINREALRLGDVGSLGETPVPNFVSADGSYDLQGQLMRSRFLRPLTTYDANISRALVD